MKPLTCLRRFSFISLYAHSMEVETEAWRREVTCPRQSPEPGINPGQSHFRGLEISWERPLPLKRGDFSKPSSLSKGKNKKHQALSCVGVGPSIVKTNLACSYLTKQSSNRCLLKIFIGPNSRFTMTYQYWHMLGVLECSRMSEGQPGYNPEAISM